MKHLTSQSIAKFNRYDQSTYYQRVQYNIALADWFQSLVDAEEWKLFTCTVVFKPIDRNNSQARYESEYKKRVLRKIRRRLERNPANLATAIPFEDFYHFERYEKSKHRATGKRCPFHIHSLIPIRTSQVRRFWSYDENKLNARLDKDLHSIDIVQDVLIEPIHESGPLAWLMYSSKGKEI